MFFFYSLISIFLFLGFLLIQILIKNVLETCFFQLFLGFSFLAAFFFYFKFYIIKKVLGNCFFQLFLGFSFLAAFFLIKILIKKVLETCFFQLFPGFSFLAAFFF